MITYPFCKLHNEETWGLQRGGELKERRIGGAEFRS